MAALVSGALLVTASRTTVRDVLALSWHTAGVVHEQLPALAAEAAAVSGQTSIDEVLAEAEPAVAPAAGDVAEVAELVELAGSERGLDQDELRLEGLDQDELDALDEVLGLDGRAGVLVGAG